MPLLALRLAIGLGVALAGPLLLLGVTPAEQWPVQVWLGARYVPIVSLLACAGYVLKYAGNRDVFNPSRIRLAHVLLAIIALLATFISFLDGDQANALILLTWGSCIPMGLVGATLSTRSIPGSWLLLPALFVALDILTEEVKSINDISSGNISWTAIYFAMTAAHRVPTPLRLLIVAGGAYVLLSGPSLGPKLAASATALVVVAKSYHSWAGAIRRYRLKRPAKFLLILSSLFLTILVATGVTSELESDNFSNSGARIEYWESVVLQTSLAGHGVTRIEFPGHGVFLGSSHNFVLDSLQTAGIIGLALMALVLWSAGRGVRRSTHRLTPYCVGVLVATSVSGGLFRSPALWLALGFLISENTPIGSIVVQPIRSARQHLGVRSVSAGTSDPNPRGQPEYRGVLGSER